MIKTTLLLSVILLSGCTITQKGELPEQVKNATAVYCTSFKNVRRNLLNFIRRFDARWESVCSELNPE